MMSTKSTMQHKTTECNQETESHRLPRDRTERNRIRPPKLFVCFVAFVVNPVRPARPRPGASGKRCTSPSTQLQTAESRDSQEPASRIS